VNQPTPITAVLFGSKPRSEPLPAVLAELGGEASVLFLGPQSEQADARALGFEIGAPCADLAAALTQVRLRNPSGDLLLMALDSVWPPHGWQRLCRAAAESQADVLCPLGPEPDYSPLPQAAESALEATALDTWCFLLADGKRVARPQPAAHAALWRASTLARRSDHALNVEAICQLYVGRHNQSCHGPAAEPDPRDAAPASPLSRLRHAIGAAPAPITPCLPGLDGRAVILHVLHGWGGGIETFVRDLGEDDRDHIHLALCASGQFKRRRYGESLSLHLVAGGRLQELRRWPLPRAIADSALEDAASAEVLRFICAAYAVSQLMVSSLIGHSLDVLQSGLPTLYVCHDYYPLWPVLHADFGDSRRRFDRAELASALPGTDHASLPFERHDADYWWQLRSALIDTLRSQRITMVAPSQNVRANWLRIAPELSAQKFEVIPHGFRPFGTPVKEWKVPTRVRKRLLVLGRINGGKALHLLEACLPELSRQFELVLLGCGAAGEALFGRSGAHIILDYRRADLPELVARLRPDAALIAATVAESFSYTLSELWALGVPPLASRIGSLAERIEDGVNGLLFDPDAEAMLALLQRIDAEPDLLPTIRGSLASVDLRSVAAARADYLALCGPLPVLSRDLDADFRALDMEVADLAAARRALAVELAELKEVRIEQDRELLRRADWAHEAIRATQKVAAQLLEMTQAQARSEALLHERTQWANTLDAESRRLGGELAQAYANYSELEREKAAADAGWSGEVARVEALRQDLLQSTSWRLTRPLRAIGRHLRGLRARLGYWLSRITGLPPRLLRSLRTRGVRGTLQRMQQDNGNAAQGIAAIELSVELGAAGAAFEPFRLPCAESPRASIIIPVYNKFPYTLACLQSLAQHAGNGDFEVIVVDDCSSDETREALAGIGGIRTLHNEHNLGFIGACNAGAAAARGAFLVFLNNDTQVTAGWLDALLNTFDQHRDVGLVGAKLVYPDGRLQEAGGIVFSDASGWNYGRFGDPRDPAYNFVREVDYCSGAAIALRRSLFEQLGGFDTRYAPAYYEDTDLAFQVREAGLRVLYQPASTVIHFEGITSGTDTGSGTKRYQVINQQKFAERWAAALPRQPKPGAAIAVAREHRVRGRILIVDATVPEPDKDSGSLRMVNVLRALIELGWKPAFTSENRAYSAGYTEQLQALGVETLHHPWIGEPASLLRETGTLWDAVMLSRHYVATPLLPLVRHYAPRATLIFDTVDLHYLREERAAALEDRSDLQRTAAATKLAELRLIKASDVTLVVSPVEQSLLRSELPEARIEVLSNVHEVAGCRHGFGERHDIYFVGGFQHQPNVDAVLWFVAEIWPEIARALPEVRFHIIGSRMPESVAALASDRVIATGFVEELDPYLDGCRLSVAPLRYGAGVKGKVNQSMAHGQPVVATTLAAEGMYLQHDVDVLIADTPAEFAAAVVRLYTEESTWTRLSAAGLENVGRHFSFEAARNALSGILQR